MFIESHNINPQQQQYPKRKNHTKGNIITSVFVKPFFIYFEHVLHILTMHLL